MHRNTLRRLHGGPGKCPVLDCVNLKNDESCTTRTLLSLIVQSEAEHVHVSPLHINELPIALNHVRVHAII